MRNAGLYSDHPNARSASRNPLGLRAAAHAVATSSDNGALTKDFRRRNIE